MDVDTDFVYRATSDRYEPYIKAIPESEKPESCIVIEKVSLPRNGIVTVCGDGRGIGVPLFTADQPLPKAGDKLYLYGKFGTPVGGMRLNDEVIYWRDEAMQDASHRRFSEDFDARTKRENDAFVPDFGKLPPFELRNQEAWDQHVRANSKSGYSFAVLVFAAQWASLIEVAMRSGATLESVAQLAERAADVEAGGITGFMYGCAVSILADVWTHGEALRVWHNKRTQLGNEGDKANEMGGVLNPAVLSLGAQVA